MWRRRPRLRGSTQPRAAVPHVMSSQFAGGVDRRSLGGHSSCTPAAQRRSRGGHSSCTPAAQRRSRGEHSSCTPAAHTRRSRGCCTFISSTRRKTPTLSSSSLRNELLSAPGAFCGRLHRGGSRHLGYAMGVPIRLVQPAHSPIINFDCPRQLMSLGLRHFKPFVCPGLTRESNFSGGPGQTKRAAC